MEKNKVKKFSLFSYLYFISLTVLCLSLLVGLLLDKQLVYHYGELILVGIMGGIFVGALYLNIKFHEYIISDTIQQLGGEVISKKSIINAVMFRRIECIFSFVINDECHNGLYISRGKRFFGGARWFIDGKEVDSIKEYINEMNMVKKDSKNTW